MPGLISATTYIISRRDVPGNRYDGRVVVPCELISSSLTVAECLLRNLRIERRQSQHVSR